MAQDKKLHLVAKELRFVPGEFGKVRDMFEVVGEDGSVIAVLYMAAQNEASPQDHVVEAAR